MTSYKDRLERELTRIRQVASDFEAAIRVDNLLNGRSDDAPKVLELRADIPVKREKPAALSGPITIRKVGKPVVNRHGATRAETKALRDGYRDRIIAFLTASGPSKSAGVVEHLGLAEATPDEKQHVYQTLYALRVGGVLKKGDGGVYRLAKQDSVPPPPAS